MAECDWVILCDYAFLDQGGKMCLIGAFDRVFAPSVPSALHQSSIAMKLLGEPNDTVEFRVEITRPTGGQLASVGGSLKMPDAGSQNVQFNIAGLPLPDYGLYAVNVYVGNELLKTTGFLVTQPPSQPAVPSPPKT
jgi:hypothetical protein